MVADKPQTSDYGYAGNNAIPTFSFEMIERGNPDFTVSNGGALDPNRPPSDSKSMWNPNGTLSTYVTSKLQRYGVDYDNKQQSRVTPYQLYGDKNVDPAIYNTLCVGKLDVAINDGDYGSVSNPANNYLQLPTQLGGENVMKTTLGTLIMRTVGFHPHITNTGTGNLNINAVANGGNLFNQIVKSSGTFSGWGNWNWTPTKTGYGSGIIDMLNTMIGSYNVGRFGLYEVAHLNVEHFAGPSDPNYIPPLYNYWGYDTRGNWNIYTVTSATPVGDKYGIRIIKYDKASNIDIKIARSTTGNGQSIIAGIGSYNNPYALYRCTQPIVVDVADTNYPSDVTSGNIVCNSLTKPSTGSPEWYGTDLSVSDCALKCKAVHVDSQYLCGNYKNVPRGNNMYDNNFFPFVWIREGSQLCVAPNMEATGTGENVVSLGPGPIGPGPPTKITDYIITTDLRMLGIIANCNSSSHPSAFFSLFCNNICTN